MMTRFNLIQVPIGAGKTHFLIQTIQQHKDKKPEAPVWVLLPDRNHLLSFREKLAKNLPEDKAIFRVETLLFEKLASHILDLAGESQRLISPAIRHAVIRVLLRKLQNMGKLSYLEKIANKPGLREHILRFIDELKQHRVPPERFAQKVHDIKNRELALIYREYQEFLRVHHLVDRDGAGWLALAVLDSNSFPIPLFLVDGFDHFTPLQAELIAAIAAQADRTFITLPSLSEASDSNTYSQVKRFQLAKERLTRSFDEIGLQLSPLIMRETQQNTDSSSLRHLSSQLFRTSSKQIPADDHIHFIAAPTPEQEIRTVLRRVKRQLLKRQAGPDQILLVLASVREYLPYLETVAREYSIPIQTQIRRPLLSNPAVDSILRCIDLANGYFTSQHLLDVLQSPYTRPTDLDSETLHFLRHLGAQVHDKAGFEHWLDLLAKSDTPQKESDTQEALRERARAVITAFFQALDLTTVKTWREYVNWLVQLFNFDGNSSDLYLDVLQRCNDYKIANPIDRVIRERDLAALNTLRKFITSLSALTDLKLDERISSTHAYNHELRHLLAAIQSPENPYRKNAVRVTTIAAARGLSLNHCYIIGLGDGNYPPSISESPLYLSSERDDLRSRGVTLREEDLYQHNGIFYQVATSARSSITLSRSYNDEGSPLPASPFWQAVKNCFTEESVLERTTHIDLSETIGADTVASRSEAFITWFAGSDRASDDLELQNSVSIPKEWQRSFDWIQDATNNEARRFSNEPTDQFSGRLSVPWIRDRIEAMFSDQYWWSASQLNEFARCGFRFFARRILALDPLIEDIEDEEATLYGDLTHQILHRTYEPFRRERWPIKPANLNIAQESLRKSIDSFFLEGSAGYIALQNRIKPALLDPIQELITQQLNAFIESDFGPESPLQAFGKGPRYVSLLEHSFEQSIDLRNTSPNRIQLYGKIDRIDQIDNTCVVIDYKSGNRIIPRSELDQGLELQLPLYLLAKQSEHDLDDQTSRTVALYWHTRTRKQSSIIDSGKDHKLLENARKNIHKILLRARSSDFSVRPTKPEGGRCVRYCPYFELCRLARTSIHKRT